MFLVTVLGVVRPPVLEEVVDVPGDGDQHGGRYQGVEGPHGPHSTAAPRHDQVAAEEWFGEEGRGDTAEGVAEVEGVHVGGGVTARASPDPGTSHTGTGDPGQELLLQSKHGNANVAHV